MLRASETFHMVSRNYYNSFSNRNNAFSQLRRFQQTSSRTKTSDAPKNRYTTMATAAGVVVVTAGVAQIALGNTNDTFFDHKLIVKNVDADDLADFFGTEAAMEAFSVFPFVTNFLMRRGVWDDEGTYRVPILLGDYLSARIEFDDEDLPPAKSEEDQWEDFMLNSTKPGEEEDDDDDDDDDDVEVPTSSPNNRNSGWVSSVFIHVALTSVIEESIFLNSKEGCSGMFGVHRNHTRKNDFFKKMKNLTHHQKLAPALQISVRRTPFALKECGSVDPNFCWHTRFCFSQS